LRRHLLRNQSRTSKHFLEPEGLVLHSQELSTCPNLGADQSSQYPPSYLSKIHINIILSPTFWSSLWSLSCWNSHKQPTRVPLLPIRDKCPPISSSLTSPFQVYLESSINFEAPRYVVTFTVPSLHPSSIQTFSSAPCFQTPSVYVFPLILEMRFQTHKTYLRGLSPQAKYIDRATAVCRS
jgi:hypothetical protein